MKNRMLEKLRSRAGESIGETLVALLIASLALLTLAGAVSAGMRVVERGKTAMKAYYDANNQAVEIVSTGGNTSETPSAAVTTGYSAVTMKGLAADGSSVEAEYTLTADGSAVSVEYTQNAAFPNAPVVAYTIAGADIIGGGD